MNGHGFIFKLLLAVSGLLVCAVLAANTITAFRMKDPEYARMLDDKKRYEETIATKDLSMRPALYWKNIERRTEEGE